MRRRPAAVAVGVGLACAILVPVAAGWIDPATDPVAGGKSQPKFDRTAKLGGGGSSVLVAGPLACTAKEIAGGVRATIRVTIAQRSAKASGQATWQGGCAKPRWRVRVPTGQAFRAGAANACALGVQTKGGAVHDVLMWCQTIRLVT